MRAAFELHRKQFSAAGHLSTANLLADTAAFKRAIARLGHAAVQTGDDDDVMTGGFIELARTWMRQAESVTPSRAPHRPQDLGIMVFLTGARLIYARENLGEPDHVDLADLSVFCEFESARGAERRWRERLRRFARTAGTGLCGDGEQVTPR